MNKLLIVIDMQNDFISGSLGSEETAGIVENVKRKISSYPKANVVATRDSHRENYLHTSEGIHLPVKHCLLGSHGWELVDEIKDLILEENIINKPSFGSFDLIELIKNKYNPEDVELELVGVCTDICVVSNALILKAAFPEVKISVDSSCCAGTSKTNHDQAINTMKSCQIEII